MSLSPVVPVLLPGRHLVTGVEAPRFRWHQFHNYSYNLKKLAYWNLEKNRGLSMTDKTVLRFLLIPENYFFVFFKKSSESGLRDVEVCWFYREALPNCSFFSTPWIAGKG